MSTKTPALSTITSKPAKAGLDRLLQKVTNGSITVKYWDGEKRTYGSGEKRGVVTIKSPKAVLGMARNLTVGFGEAYTNGEIDFDGDLRDLLRLVTENISAFDGFNWNRDIIRRSRNKQTNQRKQIAHHYDLGNNFYQMWLDESMTYSCAYFKTPDMSLEDAQDAKRAHLLRKLQLQPGMRLLDIGSGWGHLLFDAVEQYRVIGHGVTLSQEQYDHCVAEASRRGLSDKLTFELIGYQELAKRKDLTFDRVISVGMFEHVGHANQNDYFKAVHALLVDGGVSVLHTITNEVPTTADPWIDKYIFPGGYIPAMSEVLSGLAKHDLRLFDLENIGIHYAKTLDVWLERFEAHKPEVIKLYDEKFYRMWSLYLAGSASGFRYGDLGLCQFVFTKGLNHDLPLTREHLYI